jgi:putative transcriptional regulator
MGEMGQRGTVNSSDRRCIHPIPLASCSAPNTGGLLVSKWSSAYAQRMMEISELTAPCLLIASPQLKDPNFRRAVVLLLEFGDKGAMGLILSRTTELRLNTFLSSQELQCSHNTQQCIYSGGPVQTDRAFILHTPTKAGPETEEIVHGVCMSYSIESLHLLSRLSPPDMRIYLGYSGWAPEQLADEIGEGAWLIHEASSHLVFGHPDEDLWQEAFREMGLEPGQLLHSFAIH